jgi:hypothetical protein
MKNISQRLLSPLFVLSFCLSSGKLSAETFNTNSPDSRASFRNLDILKKYPHIDPRSVIRPKLLSEALTVYDRSPQSFPHRQVITVIDLSLHSSDFRFFIVNMLNGEVKSFVTTHGEGSDRDDDGWAESFSNIPGSRQSSLGVFRTAETYEGSYGYSLRLDGLSTTNSNARRRAIVVHGWSEVEERSEKLVRSRGCPALPAEHSAEVIDQIKGGSLLFIGN